jgi:hypothetical protein
MKPITIISFLLLSQIALAQIKITRLNKAAIPPSIHYAGHIIDAVKYTDIDGEHMVLTTETGQVKSKDKDCTDCRNADLYAYNYLVNNGEPKLTWQVHDFVKDCDADMKVGFLPNTFAITDLNNDNKAEVWLMYRTTCTSDVSPATMKIIMYEADKKYAVRGTAKIQVSGNPVSYTGGAYTLDEVFKTGPVVFKQYAENLWKKNLIETWK